MSQKIICRVGKSCSVDHEQMIDDSNITRQNSCFYTRLVDFIPHGRKHSYHRIFWLIATVISIFLLGYFTYNLMSPVPETHDILLIKNKTLNHQKVMINNSVNYANKTKGNSTKTITNEIEVDTRNTSKDNLIIITERTSTYVTTKESTVISPINIESLNAEDTNTPVKFTSSSATKTIIPVMSTVTVLKEPQIDLNICLKNITNRFEEVPGDTDRCVHRPIEKKSIVTFLVNDSPLIDCLVSREKACHQEYHDEKQSDIKMKYTHIFNNFIIGDHGNLYEGRPLSCRADESPAAWDYNNSRILIGKPLCKKLDSEKSWEKKQFNFALRNLLNCLETGGILSDSYKIEFSKKCKHYLDEIFLGNYEKRIVFYDGGE